MSKVLVWNQTDRVWPLCKQGPSSFRFTAGVVEPGKSLQVDAGEAETARPIFDQHMMARNRPHPLYVRAGAPAPAPVAAVPRRPVDPGAPESGPVVVARSDPDAEGVISFSVSTREQIKVSDQVGGARAGGVRLEKQFEGPPAGGTGRRKKGPRIK